MPWGFVLVGAVLLLVGLLLAALAWRSRTAALRRFLLVVALTTLLPVVVTSVVLAPAVGQIGMAPFTSRDLLPLLVLLGCAFVGLGTAVALAPADAAQRVGRPELATGAVRATGFGLIGLGIVLMACALAPSMLASG